MSGGERVFDVAIVGAGVVGCALAKELARYELDVVVIERGHDVCDGTSKANTALLHTGFDCVPGSLESRLVREGYELLRAYASASGIAVETTGAILVAWSEEQLAALSGLQQKAEQNGYLETRLLDVDELRRREPQLGPGALGGLEVPGESIIDPWSPVLAFALEALSAGTELRLGTELTGRRSEGGDHLLSTSAGELRARWLLNAAGLSSDLVNGLCGHHGFTVTPRRGELLVFDKLSRPLLRSVILPVPTPSSKGVLVSPTVFGNLLLGPTADDVDDKAATATTEDGIARLLEAGRRILPGLLDEEVTASYAGLRAATEHRDYQIELHAEQRYVCVGGIRSTGLTASLAIARHVVGLLEEGGLSLEERAEAPAIPTMPPLGEQQRRPFEDAGRIAGDPSYGQLVCHCERVSSGELRDACTGELPARDLGGLRRRTRAMNGRCQGFYCGAEVLSQLAELTGIEPRSLAGLEP
jgi:glycerol-3-phosphate dehydrogenase